MDLDRAKPALVLFGVPAAFIAVVVLAIVAWLGRPLVEVTTWEDAEVDGATVRLTYVGSECQDDAWLEVNEGDDRVELTVMTSSDADSCSDVGVLYTVSTTLSQAVGDRELVDGA